MKYFLILSGSLLVLALLFVIGVFVYINLSLSAPKGTSDEVAPEPILEPQQNPTSAEMTNNEDDVETPETVPVGGIPLRDLPLSEGQREMIAFAGIEVDTFIITPAMQQCAEEKLGAERMAAIVSGDTPTLIEMTRMLPCLNVD